MGPRSALSVMLVGLSAAACSSTGQIEHELSRIRQEMRTLRAELEEESQAREALETRVTLLTADHRSSPGSSSATRGAARGVAPSSVHQDEPVLPELPVVKLPGSVGQHQGLGAGDDGGAPVMIRLGPSAGDDRLPVDHAVLDKPDPVLGTAPSEKTSRASSSGESMNEHYARALSKLRQENDPGAARGLLLDFVARYPKSHLGPNAVYWLGECSFAEKDYTRAVRDFERVLSEHPRSAKVPDALLRLAVSFKKLGKQSEADEVARRLVAEHPDSEAAKQVPDQIGSLRG